MNFLFHKKQKNSFCSSSIEINVSQISKDLLDTPPTPYTGGVHLGVGCTYKFISNSIFLKSKKNKAIFLLNKNNLACRFSNRNTIKGNSYQRSKSSPINKKEDEIIKNYPLHLILQNLKHVHFQQKNRVQIPILTNSFENFLFPLPQNILSIYKIDQKNFISLLTIKFQKEIKRKKISESSAFNSSTNSLNSLFFKNFNVNPIFLNDFYYSPAFFLSKRKQKSGYSTPVSVYGVGNKKYPSISRNSSKNKWFDWINQTNQFVFSSESSEVLKNQKNNKSIENSHQFKIPLMKYSKLHEFKLVNISLASPEKIKEWAEKILPNGKVFGEVTNANTLHYKTFKPHKGGLFCERIFGPLKDFECACGISSKPTELESKKILQHEQIKRVFCSNCDVEYTWSVIRRYQLGYIKLVSPVTHLWYLKANPSYLSLLLDFKRSFLESIIYCTQSITLENIFKNLQITNYLDASPKNLYSLWQKLIEEEKKFQIKSYPPLHKYVSMYGGGENPRPLVSEFFYLSNFLKPFLFFNNSKNNFLSLDRFDLKKYENYEIIKSTNSKLLEKGSKFNPIVFSSLFFIIHNLFKGHKFTVKNRQKKNSQNTNINLTINQELNAEFLDPKKLFFEKSVKLEKRLKLLHTFSNTILFIHSKSNSSIVFQKKKSVLKQQKILSIENKKIIDSSFPKKRTTTKLSTIFGNFPTVQLRQFFYLKNFSFFSNIKNNFDSEKILKNLYSTRKNIFKNKNYFFKNYFFYSYYKINNLFILHSKTQTNFQQNSSQKILASRILNLFYTSSTPKGGMYPLKSKSFPKFFIPEIQFSSNFDRKKKIKTQLNNQLFLKQNFQKFCLKKSYFKILQIKEKYNRELFLFYKNRKSSKNTKSLKINSYPRSTKVAGASGQRVSSSMEVGARKQSFFVFFLFIFFCFIETKNFHLNSFSRKQRDKKRSFLKPSTYEFFQLNLKFQKFCFQKFLKEIFVVLFINQNFENCSIEKTLNSFIKKSFSYFFLQKKLSDSLKKQKDFFYNSGLTLNTKMKKCKIFFNFIQLNFLIDSEKNINIFKKNLILEIEKYSNKEFQNLLFEIFLGKKDSILFIKKEKIKELNPMSFVLDKIKINEKILKSSVPLLTPQRGVSSGINFSNIFAYPTPKVYPKGVGEVQSKMNYSNRLDIYKDKKFFLYNSISFRIPKEIELRKKILFLKKQREIKFKKFTSSFEQLLENEYTRGYAYPSGVGYTAPKVYGVKKYSKVFIKNSSTLLDFNLSISKKFGQNFDIYNKIEKISKKLPKSYFVKKWVLFKKSNLAKTFLPQKFVQSTILKNSIKIDYFYKNRGKKKSNLKFSQKLQNPIYTISYFYPWSSPLNWKSFIYYNYSSKKLQDKEIKYYKNRNFNSNSYISPLGVEDVKIELSIFDRKKKNSQINKYFREKNSISKKTIFKNTIKSIGDRHENKQLETLTGASLIQKLLTEFDAGELKKMMKQLQILIPMLNRSIRKSHKSIYFLSTIENKIKESKGKSYNNRLDFTKVQKLLQKRDHIIRRLKLISKLSHQNTNPKAMVLTILPVLPPDLRPILKLQNQIAASDLNRLYQRILYRNERFQKFLKDPSTSQSFEMKYAQRLLQESVDNLIENGKGGVKPETNSRGQALKSLSEILKGKQGRFRQYLLGKRVDYSGRSVIVVGPKLKLSECGLPWRIAIELFLPFLIQKILHYKLAKTVIGAKNFISSNQKVTWNLLNEIMKNHPILLNRAPTLHRLGIQAFIPKLIHGKAILLHPLVCPAFNADFDGDQMAVHVPITVEARTEAWSFLFSRNHLLSTATGEPIILPSQDMVLGCYYLTSENLSISLIKSFLSKKTIPSSFLNNLLNFQNNYTNFKKQKGFKKLQTISQDNFKFFLYYMKRNLKFLLKRSCFSDWDAVLNAYQTNQISLQSIIWMKWNGRTEFSNELFSPLEIRIYSCGYYEKIQSKCFLSSRQLNNFQKIDSFNNQRNFNRKYIRTTAGRVLINNIIKNCIFF